MSTDHYEIVTVASGARSVRSRVNGETFHPVVGPMVEARELYVRQQRLLERARENGSEPLVVWDVGLGAAANAIAVLEAFRDASNLSCPVELHSFERTLAPLTFALSRAGELGYFAGWEMAVRELLDHQVARCGVVTWRLHAGDFRETVHNARVASPHAVLFDPYSPATNPELWNLATFSAIRKRADDAACLLTTYSRSTAVRVTLLLAGWFVGRGGATGEKDETTIAASRAEMIGSPLDARWIERVRRSTAPGPLTGLDISRRSPHEIADTLLQHPQFADAPALIL